MHLFKQILGEVAETSFVWEINYMQGKRTKEIEGEKLLQKNISDYD